MATANKRWVDRDPQPITFPESRKRREPSFHSDTTIVEFVPGYQRSHSRTCSCGTPVASSDVYCGWCGVRLGVR